jgi:allophanate hydrolase subunit 1
VLRFHIESWRALAVLDIETEMAGIAVYTGFSEARWCVAALGIPAGSPDATELAEATAFGRGYAPQSHCV